MHIKTIEEEFKLRGIECKVRKFKTSNPEKYKATPYTIHRDTDIAMGIEGNGGRLVSIDSIEDINRIANQLKNEK